MLDIDNICNICEYLSDRDKINFLSISRKFTKLKKCVTYDTLIFNSDQMRALPYYDNFINIKLIDYDQKNFNTVTIILPRKIKHLHFVSSELPLQHKFNYRSVESITVKACVQFTGLFMCDIKNLTIYDTTSANFCILQDCKNLKYLKIISCNFRIPTYIFDFCPNIETIIFSNNIYYYSPDRLFKRCTKIKKIVLFDVLRGQITKKFFLTHSRIQDITFGDNFNDNVLGMFDSCEDLQILNFGNAFDQNMLGVVDNLKFLRKIIFGDCFNQSLKFVLKNNNLLETIKFGFNFNQDITNTFDYCCQLKSIEFGHNFNKPIGRALNSCKLIEKIYFGVEFNQQVIFETHTQLKILIFGNNFNQPIQNSFRQCYSLEKVEFYLMFNQQIEHAFDNCQKLKQIRFGVHFNFPIGSTFMVCPELTSIQIKSMYFNQNIMNSFDQCPNLTEIYLPATCPFSSKKIRKMIPDIKIFYV